MDVASRVLHRLRGCVLRHELHALLEQLVGRCDKAVLAALDPPVLQTLPRPLTVRVLVATWLQYLTLREVGQVAQVCRPWWALVAEGAATGALLQPYVALDTFWLAAAERWGARQRCLCVVVTVSLSAGSYHTFQQFLPTGGLPQLRGLRLELPVSGSGSVSLEKLPHWFPGLERLHLADAHENRAWALPRGLDRLHTLSVEKPNVDGHLLGSLAHLPALTALGLEGWVASSSWLWGLRQQLRSLRLGPPWTRGAPPPWAPAVLQLDSGLCALPHLDTLALCCNVTHDWLRADAQLPQLTQLSLVCLGLSCEDQLADLLARFPRLQRLALDCTHSVPPLVRDLTTLRPLRHLCSLTVRGAPQHLPPHATAISALSTVPWLTVVAV